jgi:hypothetical protein
MSRVDLKFQAIVAAEDTPQLLAAAENVEGTEAACVSTEDGT